MSKSNEQTKLSSELLVWVLIIVVVVWLIEKASWFWANNPDMQQSSGWSAPVLTGYLLFEGWENRTKLYTQWHFWNAAGLAFGIACLFITQIYQAAYGLTVSSMSGLGVGYILVVYSYLIYLYGVSGLKVFGFGFAFLLIVLPLPSVMQSGIIAGLQSFVAKVSVEVLMLAGIPAVVQGSLVHLPTGTVGIDEACSGIRSLQSAVMAILFIGFFDIKTMGFSVRAASDRDGTGRFRKSCQSILLELYRFEPWT